MEKIECAEKDLFDWADSFSRKIIKGLSLNLRKEVLGNIRKDHQFFTEIGKDYGIYYYIQENKVKYVGQSIN